jgi:hypothetical protein
MVLVEMILQEIYIEGGRKAVTANKIAGEMEEFRWAIKPGF